MVRATCRASSRVGSRTSPRGRPDVERPAANRATSGMAKAIVLPEPVLPRPSTSRPATVAGSVADWIGNGVGAPRPTRTGSRAFGTPSSAKPVDGPVNAGSTVGSVELPAETAERVATGATAETEAAGPAGRVDRRDRAAG